MSKPKDQVIGLKTLDLRGIVAPVGKSTPLRASKKRVFTDDEWRFLNTRPDDDLLARIGQGDRLIALLHRPEMMNMTPLLAAKVSSNLRYQQDAIRDILKTRGHQF